MSAWWSSLPVLARVRSLVLLGAWLSVSLSVVATQVRDVASGPACGGEGGGEPPGALWFGLVVLAIELAVLVAILRPWSYRRSWLRSFFAGLLCLLLSGAFVTTCMPDDAFSEIHAIWLLGMTLAFACTTVWSAVAAVAARSPKSSR